MENILNNINSSINAKNDQEILKNLKILIDKSDDVSIKEVNTFKKLLEFDSNPVQIVGAESIAELGKNEENRKCFTDEEIINRLMQFMQSGSNELIFTTIRALGNICYENEEATTLVEKFGIDTILAVLRDDSKRETDSLTVKVSGLLVNLLNTSDTLPKDALKGGILPILEKLLIKYKEPLEDNQVLMTFLLSILNILTEYLDDKEYVFSDKMAKLVINIFKKSEIPEICVLCLEIFHPLTEKDEIKVILAQEGVCELLYGLIEKYRDKMNDEESRSVLKMACDLIVLILTDDKSMDLLYDDGKGKTYKNMLTWLDSEDLDLQSTGILAIGNFARKDTHCIQMVKNGIAKKLIDLLRKYNHSTNLNDVKVQHALLSTLKNLVIPKQNKDQAIKDDIVEVMYPMLKQDQLIVIFKLLGTYRMVIDGHADVASELLSRKDFIERLVYWCYNSDHLGVRGEVPRIFSWLIKNTHSSTLFSTFLSVKDSVKCIVEMISSNHGVMQNESFFALNLLAVGLCNQEKYSKEDIDRFYNALCDATVGKNLNFVINKYGEKWDAATISNCVILLEHLVKSEKVSRHLIENEICQALEKIRRNGNAKDCIERLDKVLEVLNK